MKKLLTLNQKLLALLVSAMFLFVVGCGKDDEPKDFDVSPTLLEFPYNGGVKEITLLDASQAWNTSGVPAWLKLEYTQGQATPRLIFTATADSNTTTLAREANIAFSCGTDVIHVKVTVAGNPHAIPNITGAWTLKFFDGDSIYPDAWVGADGWSTRPETIDRDVRDTANHPGRFLICHFLPTYTTTVGYPAGGHPKFVIEFERTRGFRFIDHQLPDLSDGSELWQVPVIVDEEGDIYVIPQDSAILRYNPTTGVLDASYEIIVRHDGKDIDGYIGFASFWNNERDEEGLAELIESPIFTRNPASAPVARKSNTPKAERKVIHVSSENYVGNIKNLKNRRSR